MAHPYKPIWYFIGVFVTAFSIAFYQYTVLFPYWFSEFEKTRCLNYLIVPCLFFAITLIYSIDHWLDLKHMKEKGARISEFYKLFYARYPMVIMALLIFMISDSGGFRQWLFTLAGAVWLPLIFFALYTFNFFLARKYFVRGIKELLITAAVVAAVYCPVLIVNKPCGNYFTPSVYQVIAYALTCLANMNLFSYMEKENDEFYHFRSAYINLNPAKARIYFISLSVAIWVTLVVFFFMNKTGLGFVLASLLFILAGLYKQRIVKHAVWRILSDTLLILPALV